MSKITRLQSRRARFQNILLWGEFGLRNIAWVSITALSVYVGNKYLDILAFQRDEVKMLVQACSGLKM